ncbi:TIGR04388 family protein, partial [Leptospira interrogans]|uniref:TIGR04388 family protein n=1 Tax=Leptospira interrogans TaxID=173 RepID=UPI00077478E8
AKIDLWSRQASDFVVRHQAEREIQKRDNLLLGGSFITGSPGSVLLLDRKLFSGGLTSLITKGYRGVATTLADVGNMLGEGVVSSAFRDSVYDQTRDWRNTITQEDVKARTGQGIINKSYIETEMRNQLFDVIGETFIPGDKEAAHNLGLLLKHHIDAKEEKKQAKEQRLRDAQTIVQVAAAAAAIYFTAGAASGAANSWLSTLAIQTGTTTTASVGGVSTVVATGLTNGQILALAASTAVSMGVEGSINGTNGALSALVNGVISAATMGVRTPLTGYVSYTKHQNANLLTGQHEVKGGWGGGFSVNISGAKASALGEAMQTVVSAMKMSNLNFGLSYNQDSGLGMNVNTNFTSGLGLGLDYNFKSGDYTANASYDKNHIGGQSWANASFNVSASKTGHASASVSYNSDGNTAIPQRLRGGGGTLDFGNDGKIGLSVQGMKGATIGTLTYDTNTHGFEPVSFNSNFQNEFNQGQAAENSSENHERNQIEILMKEISLGSKMDKPLFTEREIDSALPRDGKGGIDMENANPEKLLEKWNAHKEKMSQTPEGLQKWKEEVTRAGERSGIEVRFNEGKSATSTFGKFVTGLVGDIAQSFGFANDGSKMVDKAGVFHLDTCFVSGSKITKLKNKNIKIYGNINISSASNGASLSGFSSEDYEFANIEEIRIGDVVRSWNENTNTFENKRVTQVFMHEVPQLFFLELDGEEEIHTTWNHPFRRKTQNAQEVQPFDLRGVERSFTTHEHVMNPSGAVLQKRNAEETASLSSQWVKVEDLRLRDQVLRSDGSWGTVTGIYYYNTEPTKVYNLEVEDNHTYVVGGDVFGIGYVVHNYDQKMRDVLAKVKTSIADRIAQATDRESFDFEGSTWIRKGGEPILDKKGKVIGKQPHYYESASNQYHKNDRLYIEPTADGKDIQLKQYQREGEYYTNPKIYDKYLNWTGNVDFAGNLPHLNPSDPNSVRFHVDYTDKFANERGYHFEKDGNGKTKTHTMNVDGESRSYINTTDGGRVLLGYTASTQREAYYQDLTANNKKIIYELPKSGDHLDQSGICNSAAPGTVMRGLGFKMTDAQVHDFGRSQIMIAREIQEYGVTLANKKNPDGIKPSGITIEKISEKALSHFGFEIPQKGSVYNDVKKPTIPKREDFDSDFALEQEMRGYNNKLEARAKSSLDKVKPWIIDQIKHGNAVVAGGDFTGYGHVVTIVGYDSKGYIVHDSWGDANVKKYKGTGTSGQYVHYPFDKFSLGYGYILRKKK